MDDTEYEVQKALGLTKVFCVYATRDDACTTRESFEVRAIDKDNAILRCKGHITKVDPDCEWRE